MPAPRTLEEALDQSVARANAAAQLDAAEAQETGDRWAAWLDAERAAGPHAAVLPIATARDLLAFLDDETPTIPPATLRDLLEAAIVRADNATQE